MPRSRRDLNPEDLKLWRHVTRSVSPLHEFAPRHPEPEPEETPRPVRLTDVEPLQPPAHRKPHLPPLVVGVMADMDRRTAKRLKRGDMQVDGRIDLHGLTVDQAHGALTSYLRAAHVRGARCVVVVTGKGKAPGVGKIRNEAPHWLNQAPLRSLVLAVTEARSRDGGAGALYVLLKRKR